MNSLPREWMLRGVILLLGLLGGWCLRWMGPAVLPNGTTGSARTTEAVTLNNSQADVVLNRSDATTASNDPQSVAGRFGLAMLERSPHKRRARFLEALETMTAADANDIRALFGRLDRQGMMFPGEWMAFCARWGEVDGAAAIAHAEKFVGQGWAKDSAQTMFEAWASADRPAAEAWLKANEKSPLFEPAFVGYTRGLAEQDLAAATRMAQKSVPAGHDLQWRVSEALAEAAVRQGQLSGLSAWYEGLPDTGVAGDLKRAAFGHVWWRYAHAGEAEGMAFLSSQASQPWRSDQQYGEMVQRVVAKDPVQAIEWLATLPPSPNDGSWPGTGRAIREWMAKDPPSAQAWLQNTNGPFADFARSQWQRLVADQAKPAPQ